MMAERKQRCGLGSSMSMSAIEWCAERQCKWEVIAVIKSPHDETFVACRRRYFPYEGRDCLTSFFKDGMFSNTHYDMTEQTAIEDLVRRSHLSLEKDLSSVSHQRLTEV